MRHSKAVQRKQKKQQRQNHEDKIVRPTAERAQHAALYQDEVMVEGADGHLATKAVVTRVRAQRWIDIYLSQAAINNDQHDAAVQLVAIYERAGLSSRPSALNLLRAGCGAGLSCGMAANEAQAAARISFRKLLLRLGRYEAMVRRVVCDDCPVIPVRSIRGRRYTAERDEAMKLLRGGLDVASVFFGMRSQTA